MRGDGGVPALAGEVGVISAWCKRHAYCLVVLDERKHVWHHVNPDDCPKHRVPRKKRQAVVEDAA